MEGRITSSIAAAQEKLRAARQAEDTKAETEALADISQLGYEQGKLAELKTAHQMQEQEAKENLSNNQNYINNRKDRLKLRQILWQKLGLKTMSGSVKIVQ